MPNLRFPAKGQSGWWHMSDRRRAALDSGARALAPPNLSDADHEATRAHVLALVRQRAVGFARRLSRPEDAEDLAQEALLVLQTRYAHLDRTEDLVPVALRIVRFKAAGLWRKRYRRGEEQPHPLAEERLTTDAPGPDDIAARNELLEKLAAAVAQLGGRCRELLRLKLAGHDFPEIRVAMGASTINAVYTWDHRCRKELRERLGLDLEAHGRTPR